MAATFTPRANTVLRLVLAILLATPVALAGGLMLLARMPEANGQFHPLRQPIDFDHRHHVGDDGIDCRYCHSGVERSPFAGLPATGVCMNCHAQVWNRSPLLEPVRAAWFKDESIPWQRVYRLPDYVFFNHSIHVNKGVGCVTCHGRVDLMPAVEKITPLTMGWCLDCHRDPTPYLRPREHITDTTWKPDGDPEQVGKALMERYHVQPRTSCTTCHR